MTVRIGFIGAGRMGGALIGGLIAENVFEKDEIIACTRSTESGKRVAERYGISVYRTAKEVASKADMLVLAVKPKQVEEVLVEETEIRPGTIVLSVVAGLTIAKLKSYAPEAKIVRVMPNHCVAVREGAMGYATDGTLTKTEKNAVKSVFESVGLATEVPEELIDAVTGVAGSSPAFVYMVIDAMAEAAVRDGMGRDEALKLAAQSALGAAKMVLESDKSPSDLVNDVCSPGGTTIEGVRLGNERGLPQTVTDMVTASIARSKEMSGNRCLKNDFARPSATRGPLDQIDPASQSRSFLLAMVEFIILVPCSLISHRRASLSVASSISIIRSTRCISSRACSVRFTLSA